MRIFSGHTEKKSTYVRREEIIERSLPQYKLRDADLSPPRDHYFDEKHRPELGWKVPSYERLNRPAISTESYAYPTAVKPLNLFRPEDYTMPNGHNSQNNYRSVNGPKPTSLIH